MAFISYLSLVSTFVFYATANHAYTPRGVSLMCHDRYFMISVDQLFTGKIIKIEAFDENGVYPINEEYAAKCGYSFRVLRLKNNAQIRASYFSCHTEHRETEEFSFGFNLITHHKGKEVTHALQKTCSPSLPWSLREVTCETNYMEVSVRSEITCPSSKKRIDWDDLKLAHSPSSAEWQVTFQRDGEQLPPMSLKAARSEGYVFDLMGGRLVFRAPYRRPHSFTSTMKAVKVEVVHATLFSRQSWLVLLVDLVAACSVYKATYDDEGYMLWKTPDVLYPGLQTTNYSFGLSGDLLQSAVAEEKGYVMTKYNGTVQIHIPCDAEGSIRKSVVSSGDLFELFAYDFYMEQISVDDDNIETRSRTQRTIRSPPLKQTLLDENRTVLKDHRFTIYLGDIPQDLQLISVELNGHLLRVPFQNDSTLTLARVVHPNNTKGYILTVPFDNSPVIQQLSGDDFLFKLNINYRLMVMPENDLYNHSAAYVAILPDLSPPQFEAFCSESSISFKLDHKKSLSKWVITVGSDPLTSELAVKKGFIMSNNSKTLQLDVPLLSDGYDKKNFSLQGFMGTYEIYVRDRETSEVQSSAVQSCPFYANELIVCTADMTMTAVVDLSLATASGGVPSKMTLLDQKCGPIEADATKGLFSFLMIKCGSKVKFGAGSVTYENEILYMKTTHTEDADRVFLQCTYPVSSLHRLFSKMIFKSDTPGIGRIIHTAPSATSPQSTTKPPALPPQQSPHASSRFIQVAGLKQLKHLEGLRVFKARRAF